LHDNLSALSDDPSFREKISQDTKKAVRILRFIIEYIVQYDREFGAERKYAPLAT